MKLLFDENISFKLCKRLEDIYPVSTHVRFAGLESMDDTEVWQYAKDGGYTIVTQDSDFNDMSFVKGFPPCVVWMKAATLWCQKLKKHFVRIQ